jgi:hypothetical protein
MKKAQRVDQNVGGDEIEGVEDEVAEAPLLMNAEGDDMALVSNVMEQVSQSYMAEVANGGQMATIATCIDVQSDPMAIESRFAEGIRHEEDPPGHL